MIAPPTAAMAIAGMMLGFMIGKFFKYLENQMDQKWYVRVPIAITAMITGFTLSLLLAKIFVIFVLHK